MSRKTGVIGMLAGVASVLAILSFLGCESSRKSDNAFNIEPQSVTLTASNTPTQLFVASGGTEPYAWSLDDDTLGTLNKTVGTQVEYTAKTNLGNNVLRAVDDAGQVSTAVIRQQ